MDTRHPIQHSPDPVVLSVSFNQSRNRMICGLDDGVRVFRANDCIRTLKEPPTLGRGYAIATALDDRYIVLVGGGRNPNASPNKLQFWDGHYGGLLKDLDFHEPILGVRMTDRHIAVILGERTVYLHYHHDGEFDHHHPGSVSAIHDTASNPYALCCVQGDTTVLPGLTAGQVQIIGLADKTKKIIRAHASELRHMDLSSDGQTLATASKQGTLIRVFSVASLSQTHEFRRGVDAAIIYSLAISPRSHFIACTSDKGTIHIFDLRLHPTEELTKIAPVPQKRTSVARVVSQSRRAGSVDFDTQSLPSQSSSPRPPSQAFYTPPADIVHAPPTNAPSALSALAKLPGMPKALSDVRSLTSAPYHLGSDPANWQGQPAFISTTLPNGQSCRVKNPNIPVPGLPDGKPPKGILCWDPESGDRKLWCVGGGADARWEVFDLLETNEGRIKLAKGGYRSYLSRQFPEASE
ncbi:WD40 repeat-like protein [Myriangium duriaei CBS 260.36]|uniref:WD40 repeat-like protein n=1 Tax=Myriangium duriaei CBS 260.36 TaxID=1168546 RepID=A0A9P4MJX4_9PEZI|nr:WD40 repeat-like protein [Myriangium duriaei CBS 260.36]